MYRDVLEVAKSMYRMSMADSALRLRYLYLSVTGRLLEVSDKSSDFCGRLCTDLTYGVFRYALVTASYLDLRRRGVDVSALRYEDLVARPLDMCRVVLEFCHLPASLAELAVRAFDVDSQRNSILAISAIGPGLFKEPQLTPQTKTKLNELLKKYNMPLIGEPTIIDGTLSCS